MTIQNNVNVKLVYGAESTFGTASAAAGQLLRRVSSTLALSKDVFASNEVRPDQQVADSRHGVKRVSGAISGELSTSTWDDFFAAVLRTTWASDKLVPGTARPSFTIEENHPDLDISMLYKGCRIGEVGVSLPPTGIATVNWNIMGQDMALSSGAGAPVFVSPTAATTRGVLDAVNGTLEVQGAGSAIVTGLDFTINNNLSSQPVVGSNKVPEIFFGRFIVTGNLTAFFDSVTMLNYFINETEITLKALLNDLNGTNSLSFKFGRVKLNGGSKTIGPDGGVILQSPFQAIYASSVSGFDDGTMSIVRV
ncbi:hypothetical protein UFOVP119_81 [uncultured Caudovirales phage]|uniref:Major tail protein n=1 Tax=uncultured Caudovirales phage TaxID=2100421 RepID=A0A6J5LBH7_9CAUD|nr:hypothetical protein UFOVP119_81 [uncultured Caudovirales phage]